MISRVAMVVAAGLWPAVAGVAGVVLAPGQNGLTADEVELVVLVMGAAVAVATIIAWVDRRIDKKIRDSNEIDKLRHQQIRAELRHLTQMVSLQLKVPVPPPEDEGG